MTTETKHAICRFCHAMCPVKVTLDGGRITGIIGDKDNPVYHGYSCIKGRNFHNFHYAPDPVTRPLKRGNDGSFAELPLDQSLDEIARKLQHIIDQHGSRSVAMYSGTFSHFCPAGVMTRHAFMDAIRNAGPQILEPVVSVDVTVPEAHMGDVTGNLAGRRARISGTESLSGGLVTVTADMPLSGLTDYHTELKSMSQGQGSFTMEFSHYDPVPHDLQRKLEAAFRPREVG